LPEDASEKEEDCSIRRVSAVEYGLGDYRPGRFAWRVENAKALEKPIAMTGRLGIYEVPDQLLAQTG
jgi:hypothetical protein